MEQINAAPKFVIDSDPVVEWPVIVSMPIDGGSFADFQLTAVIRVLSPQEFEALTAAASSGAGPTRDQDILAQNAEIFGKLIRGWSEVLDQAGNQIPFSPEALTAVTTGAHGLRFSAAMWKAIGEVRWGAPLKNSVPPPAGG